MSPSLLSGFACGVALSLQGKPKKLHSFQCFRPNMSVNVSESFRLRCCSVRKAPPAFEVTFSVLERILFNTLIYNHVFSFDRRNVVTVSYSPANQIVTHLSGEEMRLWKNMRVTDVVCMSAPCLADYVGQCGFGYDPWRCLFQCGNFPASTKTLASKRLSCAQKHFPNMNNRIQIYTC